MVAETATVPQRVNIAPREFVVPPPANLARVETRPQTTAREMPHTSLVLRTPDTATTNLQTAKQLEDRRATQQPGDVLRDFAQQKPSYQDVLKQTYLQVANEVASDTSLTPDQVQLLVASRVADIQTQYQLDHPDEAMFTVTGSKQSNDRLLSSLLGDSQDAIMKPNAPPTIKVELPTPDPQVQQRIAESRSTTEQQMTETQLLREEIKIIRTDLDELKERIDILGKVEFRNPVETKMDRAKIPNFRQAGVAVQLPDGSQRVRSDDGRDFIVQLDGTILEVHKPPEVAPPLLPPPPEQKKKNEEEKKVEATTESWEVRAKNGTIPPVEMSHQINTQMKPLDANWKDITATTITINSDGTSRIISNDGKTFDIDAQGKVTEITKIDLKSFALLILSLLGGTAIVSNVKKDT
ncbi:MAG: hypothetical protein WCO06_06465 [Candidatus Roizmanbacteria bacterium]